MWVEIPQITTNIFRPHSIPTNGRNMSKSKLIDQFKMIFGLDITNYNEKMNKRCPKRRRWFPQGLGQIHSKDSFSTYPNPSTSLFVWVRRKNWKVTTTQLWFVCLSKDKRSTIEYIIASKTKNEVIWFRKFLILFKLLDK